MLSRTSLEENDSHGVGSSASFRQGMESVLEDSSQMQSRGETEDEFDTDKYKQKNADATAKSEKSDINLKTSTQSLKKLGSKLSTSMTDDFDMEMYKTARGNLNSRQKKTSVIGNYPDSKQSTKTENMVKASYRLTEDVLDPDKSGEPWVNTSRELKSGIVVCSTHDEAPVIMHCKTCDRLVCDECITSTHKPHDLVEIRKQGLQDKLILTEKLPDVRTRAIPSLRKNLDGLSHTKSKCTEEFDSMIDQIKHRSSVLIMAIETARDRLISRCSSDKDASHAFLNKLEDKLSTGLVSIEASANSSDEALQMDKDPATVHERIKLQWLLDKYRRSHPQIIYPKFQNGTAPREEATLEKMIGYFDGMLKCEAKDQLHKIMLNVTPLGSLKPLYVKQFPTCTK